MADIIREEKESVRSGMVPKISEERQIVWEQLGNDERSANEFIDTTWPTPEPEDREDERMSNSSFITYAVSTTLNSSVLLIARGLDTLFTRNTFSEDPSNPWLVFQDVKDNQELAQHIQNCWEEMNIQAPGDRTEVDKIAPHILYRRDRREETSGCCYHLKTIFCQRERNEWMLVPLANDCVAADNTVRFRVEDIEIWTHPPRDEALMRTLTNVEGFNRVQGDLRSFVVGWTRIRNNPNIPADKKPGALEEQRVKIKNKFVELYQFYETLDPEAVPVSYQYPTIQLGQRKRNSAELQRYGRTFAGVYGTFDNETHMKYPAPNATEPRQLPSEADVYNKLVGLYSGLSFEDMIR